jgi:hypothetical protein
MKGFTMQFVDLYDDNENPICCPFCGTKICRGAGEEETGEWIVGECEHLLFAAHDEGIEYSSERFEKALEAASAEKGTLEDDEIGPDFQDLIEKMKIKNAFAFHSVVGPPAQFSTYVGFAPVE